MPYRRGLAGVGDPGGLVGPGDADGHDALAVGALQGGGELGESAGEIEMELGCLWGEFEVGELEVGFDLSGRLETRPVLRKKRRNLGPLDDDRALEGFAKRARHRQRREARRWTGVQDPERSLERNDYRRPRLGLQREGDRSIGLQRGAQGQDGGFFLDRERLGTPQRHARESAEGREDRGEIAGPQLHHSRGVAARDRLEGQQHLFVLFREAEAAAANEGIERSPVPARDPFQNDEHLPTLQGFLEVGRKDHMHREGGACGIASKPDRILPRDGAGRDGGCRSRGGAGGWLRRGNRCRGLQPVETDGDDVGADRPEFARLPAGAEVLDVEVGLDDEAGAVGVVAGLDDPLEEWGRPVRGQDLPGPEQEARMLHGFPSGGLLEEGLGQLDISHADRTAGG